MSAHSSSSSAEFHVLCLWDHEAKVWYVADSNVPGLATEANTAEKMSAKLAVMIPELLEYNGRGARDTVPWELTLQRNEELRLRSA